MRRAARAADPAAMLSVAQLEMLSCLAENPGARPGQLARLLRLAPSSVATLTPAGEAAVIRWKVLNENLLQTAFAALPAGSRGTIQAALGALSELAGAVDALADEQQATAPPPAMSA
jgi:hypothetical protein